MIFALAAIAALVAIATRQHGRALERRRHLLDAAARLFADGTVSVAPDGFPALDARLPDRRRVRAELISDTLVFRRLPQLWLKLTLVEHAEMARPSIGALSRPTGAEFYSMVHGLPRWLEPPPGDASMLMRGDGRASPPQVERAGAAFQALFRDQKMKEAVIMPRGVRLVCQAAEGELGHHAILRQARFSIETVSPELVRKALAELEMLSQVFAEPERQGAPASQAEQLTGSAKVAAIEEPA